jgi:hypothetical protein
MPRSRAHSFFRGAAVVWSVVAIVAHSNAGVAFPLWTVLFVSLLAIAIGWTLALSIATITARPPDRARRDVLRSWIRIPLPILLTLGLIWFALPLRMRLFFSGPALQQSGAYLAQLPQSRFQEHPQWIGLFRVRAFSQFGDELRFLTGSCGLVDNCGLVFSPNGPPPNRGEDTFEHLYGDWWHWHQSW